MSTQTIVLILIALFVVLILFWLIRSRGNTSGHIDTTMTGLGAATEAVEDIVETVAHRAESMMKGEAAATGASPGDTAAMESAVAANMASAGGAATMAIGIPAAQGAPDNLRQLKGVGPKLNTVLIGLGITRFDQIAAWGPAEIEKVDAQLGNFKGRIARDNWIEQAGFLAKGDIAGFEAKFGKLDSPSNT